MAIKLTQEDAAVLSQMAYMNIAKENDFNDRFKGSSLQKMAADLLADRKKAIAEGKDEPTFDQWGSFTDKEQYDMLEKLAAGDYPDLSNLKVKDYKNDEGKDNFVGYAFSGENPQDVVCAFRGTMGSKMGEDFKPFGDAWLNNYNLGVNGGSLQFKPTKDFVEKNMIPGAQTIVTGHSQGGGDALYASATIPGVTGVVFDAPGIDQDLTPEQRAQLAESHVKNIVNQDCPIGAVLFHSEERIFAKYFDHKDLDQYGKPKLDENGLPKNISGFFAGHYLQTIHFDKGGNVIPGARSQKSEMVEAATQATYNDIELRTKLGLAVSAIQLAKGNFSDVADIRLQQLKLLGEDIKSLGSQISNAGANIVNSAEAAITNTANQAYQAGANAVNSAEAAITNTANQVYQAGANAVNSAEAAIANTANQAYQAGANAVNSAEAAIANTANQAYQAGANAVNSAEAAITDTANQVYQDGANAVNSAEAAITNTANQAYQAGANAVNSAEAAIANTANQVYQDGANAVNSAEAAIANTANQAYQAGANAVNSAEAAIANTANQVYQDGANAVNSAEAAITNTANQAYQAGANAVNSAEAAITNTANQAYQAGANAVNSAEAAIGSAAQSAETAIRNVFSSNDTASSQAPAEDNSNAQQAAQGSEQQPPAEPAQDTSASQTPSIWDSAVQSLQSWVAGTNESQEQTQGQRI